MPSRREPAFTVWNMEALLSKTAQRSHRSCEKRHSASDADWPLHVKAMICLGAIIFPWSIISGLVYVFTF